MGNVIAGAIKRIKYGHLIKKYQFDAWHLSPYEWKEYAQACVRYVNATSCKTAVDIGCGLGEILAHIHAQKKIGLDLSEAAIRAACELHGRDIQFYKGSFGELAETPVDCLITLNFMHGREESQWADAYREAAARNNVGRFIVDTVPKKAFGPSTHALDWKKILPENYERIARFGPFLSGRFVEVWEKR